GPPCRCRSDKRTAGFVVSLDGGACAMIWRAERTERGVTLSEAKGACLGSCPLRFAQGDSRPIPETQVCRGNVTVQVVSNPPRVLYTVVTVSRCGRRTPTRSSGTLAVARSWTVT